jgi:hypothetical protein
MTEQLKVPTQPRLPQSYEDRLTAMSSKDLQKECRRLVNKPKLEGAEALILLVTIFNDFPNGNDPYILDHHSMKNKALELKERRPRHA